MTMTHRSLRALLLAVPFALAVPLATAQPGLTITHPGTGSAAPTEPLRIFDPYADSQHFVVRHLRLENQGPTIHVQPGSTVHAQLDVNVHCTHCATPHNHILVGFPGQEMASTCAWSGLRESGGWRTEQFTLIAPMRPGVYPIRVRNASTSNPSCDDATLAHWTRDLPGGPGADATIGVLVVESPRPVAPAPGSGAAPVTPAPVGTTPIGTSAAVGTPAGAGTTTSVVPPATAPATLSNASFESPDVAANQSVPMAEITGWVRTSGSGVEVHDAPGRAAGGAQYVELDGVDSSALAADLATAAGQHYRITLAFAPRPGTGVIDNRLEVLWNGDVVATVGGSGEGMTHPHWTRLSVRVRAAGGSGRLELRDAGASNGQGTLVDDVSVVPTP